MKGESVTEFYKVYKEHRGTLLRYQEESQTSFDKTLLALSAGALAISITFINQIAPEPRYFTVCVISWALFALTLTVALVAHFISHKALGREIAILDKAAELTDWNYTDRNPWNAWTSGLNIISLLTFILGTASLVVFATLNAFN